MIPLISLLLCGSPVPPPVVPSTPGHMVGSWEYDWGQMKGGRITLAADGYYASYHSPRHRTEEGADGYTRVVEECVYTHTGRWEWDGRTLILWEYRLADWWDWRPPTCYAVDFGSPRGYTLTGTACNGCVPVRLAKLPPE